MIGSGRRGLWRIDKAGLLTCRFVPAGFGHCIPAVRRREYW
jgi:hypothetical protein